MRACLLDVPSPVENRPLRWAELPTPEPRAGELLLRVRACGVCRTDLHVVEGELARRRSPLVPGHQIVGIVEALGPDVSGFRVGDRVGVGWLHSTCGRCKRCTSGRENLCAAAELTGWTTDGGYAEHARAVADFVYPIPDGFEDLAAAPLLCAGIIGYRALRLTGITSWSGARLGLYGFGAAGHVAIQIARARGADVYVCTRDRERHQALAGELGAAWVGDAAEAPPVALDASIVFAPAGELVPPALRALDEGGTLVLGGIHMSPIPELEYALLWRERVVRSVANNTRADGREFLAEAARAGVHTSIETFPLERANDALRALKHDAIRGAAVLVVGE
ncbi:MAG: zinc-dependent alcohol dehydrogenase family protein [Deltaproteobacteria bacterium]|nr:zinc-dependent alcohol dehydrogenase family protein [Deltaproteobacteria bacterium]